MFNLWETQDYPQQAPPVTFSETLDVPMDEDRPISIDVFYPSYNEDEDLVRLSLLDAKKSHYPHPIQITIHLLDDGSLGYRARCQLYKPE